MTARFLYFACVALAAALPACSGHPDVSLAPADSGANDGGGLDAGPLLPDGGPVEWDGWAGAFVTEYCVQCHNPGATSCLGSGCHPANGPVPDFRLRSNVVAYGPIIRCGVSVQQDPSWQCSATIPPEKFPVDGGTNPLPTDAERAIFVEWIGGGAP